jgi:DNA gyrase subunit A
VRLAEGDAVVGMEILSGKPDILTVTAKGYGKRTPVEDYRLQGRGGSGIINMRTTERNGNVVATMEVTDADQALIITANGKIIRLGVSGISRIGRATQGVRLIQCDAEDRVVSAIRTAEREPTELLEEVVPPPVEPGDDTDEEAPDEDSADE